MSEKYNFDSSNSHFYTNIRFEGNELYCVTQNLSQITTRYKQVIDNCLTLGNLRQSDIQEVRLGDRGDFHFPHYKDSQVLIVMINSRFLTESYIRKFYDDVITKRTQIRKTTIVLDCNETGSHGIRLMAPENRVSASIDFESVFHEKISRKVKRQVHPHENICFLDIDGVLLPQRTFVRTNWSGTHAGEFLTTPVQSSLKLDQDVLAFLRKISNDKSINFILCSQWRIGMTDTQLEALGRYMGIPIIGSTPNLGNRDHEIKKWIDGNNPTGVLTCLDDEVRKIDGVVAFKVNPKEGITWCQMERFSKLHGGDIHDYTDSAYVYK